MKKNHFDDKRKNLVIIDAELLGKTTSNKLGIILCKGTIYIVQLGGKSTSSKVLFLIRESYSWLMVFHHWGASKLERAFETKKKLLTWDDVDAQTYFGSVKPYGL